MSLDAPPLWSPETVYLNTATYGLPPRPAFDVLQQALADWRAGRGTWERWGDAVGDARCAFARLVGVAPETVACAATVSELVGLVAAALPDGARVLAPDVEFTSNLFPWLVHAERGVHVVTVPPGQLVEAVDERVSLVALSAVQSSTGEVADLSAIVDAAGRCGAQVLVDATQACGWLPLDAARFDYLVCAAYKWLLSPRGSAFLTVRPERLEQLTPLAAGWFAGESIHDAYYGPPLRLARTARRLDTSPAWFSWVGTLPALQVLLDVGVERVRAHDVALANRFRAGLGLPAGDSAIVTVDVPAGAARLEEAGVVAAVRAGKVRASFHLYNSPEDVDRALAALG